MKVVNLRISNFIGISDANLSIRKKVALFTGENGAGKSSLACALEYLAMGTARGLSLKKDRHRLIRRGSGKAEVVATLEGDITLRRTTSATSETFRAVINNQERGEFPFPWNPIGLNPQLYFDKPVEERKTMLYRLVSGDSSADIIAKKLIDREIPEAIAKQMAADVADLGFDAVRASVIEERKALKREREALKEITEPSAAVTLDDAEYILTDYTEEQLGSALQTLQQRKDELLVEKGKVSAAVPKAAIQAELERVLNELSAADNAKFDDPDQYREKLKTVNAGIDKLNADISAAKATKKLMEENANLKVPNLTFEVCPVMEAIRCPVPMKDRKKLAGLVDDKKRRAQQCINEADQEIANLTDTLRGDQEQRDALEKSIASLEQAIERSSRALAELKQKKADLENRLESAADVVGDTKKYDDEIVEIGHRSAVGIALLGAVRRYLAARQAFEKAAPQIEKKDAAIKTCDLLDKALAPGGIPAEITGDSMGAFKARVAKTGKAFGVTIDVNADDYLPLWNGQHYNLLCESEKWRARLFFQEAIAYLAKTPWLIIDEASILDFKNRGSLFDIIFEIASDYDFVAVFATQNDENIPVIEHELIDFWRVHDGKVALVSAARAAA